MEEEPAMCSSLPWGRYWQYKSSAMVTAHRRTRTKNPATSDIALWARARTIGQLTLDLEYVNCWRPREDSSLSACHESRKEGAWQPLNQPTRLIHAREGIGGRGLHPITATHTIPYQHSNPRHTTHPWGMCATQTSSKDSNSWQESKYPRNPPKRARKLRRINDGTCSNKQTKGPQPFKNTEFHENKKTKTEFNFQVAASSTLETDQFCKTQQRWIPYECCGLSGEGLCLLWQPQHQK